MTRPAGTPHTGHPDRRKALALLGSAIGVSLARCTEPQEEIVPYVEMPERMVPGVPLRFATAAILAGYGRGVLGITTDGRPTKVEGNPRHPYSLGATDVFAEGEILSLYDPDRSPNPLKNGELASWQEFTTEWTRWSETDNIRGAGMVLLTGRITSPTILRGIATLTARFPELRHIRYEPLHDDAARAGARDAFGRVLEPIARWQEADIVVSLDADPLGPGPALLRNARGFAARRGGARAQRLYCVESGWSATGAAADHRLAMRSDRILEIARALVAPPGIAAATGGLSPEEQRFVRAILTDVHRAGATALFLAGESQSPAIHAACHWLNAQFHAPVDLVSPADPHAQDHASSLAGLLQSLGEKRVHTLVILDANPVYDEPLPKDIRGALAAVPFTVHAGPYGDETAELCRWHLPLSHVFESWGDVRSPDGTAALIQPLIRPLYATRSAPELLALLAGDATTTDYDLTRETWRASADGDFSGWWRRALVAGTVAQSASTPVAARAAAPKLPDASEPSRALGLTIAAHPSLWDGRYANNAWLQECPAPFTKEVWGNAVQISPEDARGLGIADGDDIILRRGDTDVEAVAAITSAQAPGAIRAFAGQGRWRAGAIGSGIGARVRVLAQGLESAMGGIVLRKGARHAALLSTQAHTKLEGRDEDLFPLAAAADIAGRLAALPQPQQGIVPPAPAGEYAWAMVIDNDRCIGCNACVVACQSENNVPVVGPDEIARGRDMHWLRVDAYEIAAPDGTRRGFQPVPCMHCETAPCEPVCPVAASVHDHEGLNVQVYNRCIGTRFCEANCPYKVRRFNYFGYGQGQEYANLGQPPMLAQRNPNVSVRGRGVMEKCTYCVQRISAARRQAEKDGRSIADGEVVTACQAACPTRAIHFGNRNRESSEVALLQKDQRHYALLGHLDTRPRTTYLAKTFHPAPALERQA